MVDPENPAALRWRWTLVFVLNLALPVPVGLSVTRAAAPPASSRRSSSAGRSGWRGATTCRGPPGPRPTAASYVAMFQVFPVVHFVVGIGAIILWDRLVGYAAGRATGWRAALGGFGVSMLTALPLIFAAWVLGGGPGLLFAGPVARTPDEADYIEAGPPTPQA